MSIKRIHIIGGGIIGLTTAIQLQQQGYQIHITAAAISPSTTSDIAGALFEPIAGTGPAEKIKEWSSSAFQKFYTLSENKETGVVVTFSREYFCRKVEDPCWRDSVRRFRKLSPSEFPNSFGIQDGYVFETVVLNPSTFMAWLWKDYFKNGGTLKIDSIDSLDEVLKKSTGFDLVVNCTGLQARFLCNDPEVYPIKGQILRVWAPWVTEACCFLEQKSPSSPVTYIIPRGDGSVVLGGLFRTDNWDTTIDWEIAKEIRERCIQLVPQLGTAEILGHSCGLRPWRKNVRLELVQPKDSNSLPIIHNYGHGGSGITLAWGCAGEVGEIVKSLNSTRPQSKL
eukprot:TRINITY_DN5023_c0_g1_i1.p1 TRINITY_DN5023_c0_g1~~TRINITY_DN5023_c0_g1_i1.p1  ORF type:complete len:357 (-),score=75.35 TRINITY_DN5023_c0_g1_i1:74-1090(-)